MRITNSAVISTTQTEQQAREAMLRACEQLTAHDLYSAGLFSMGCRWARSGAGGVLITPVNPAHTADDWDVNVITWHTLSPASDAPPWPGQPAADTNAQHDAWLGVYRGLFKEYPSAQTILLLTPPYASALACQPRVQQEGLPPIHPALAAFGPAGIACAPYIATGTAELDQQALDTLFPVLAGSCACLLANLGMLVMGESVDQAVNRAISLEGLARICSLTFQMGEPALLDADQFSLGLETWQHPT